LTTRIAIFGAGGHGKVVWDILVAAGHEVVGFADRAPASEALLGLPVVYTLAELPPHDGVVVAIGDNRARKVTFERLRAEGVPMINAIHPNAVLARHVRLGTGVVVAAGVVINVDVMIHDNAIINTGATVDHDSVIGPHAHVSPGCRLAGMVQVEEGALLGIGTCAIPGMRIGAWATTGAGSVIIRDVAPGTVVVGVPARLLARRV
jgi:sugar O-acyltransferase (sialic acid O-acetyltransferase NeuD family)